MNAGVVVSRDGTRIAYEVAGSGPALILVDGALCHRESGPMRALAAALSGRFTVYCYDRRGRGQSNDTPPYEVTREIEDIDALVTVAGGAASVFGISSGAVLAVKAARVLGERVRALAVYEPPLVTDAPGQGETLEFTKAVDGFLEKGDRDGAATAFMVRVMKTLGYPAEAVHGMKGTPMWQGILALAPTIGYDNHLMGGGGVPDEAPALTVPTLVVCGGDSPEGMQGAAKALASAIPGARLQVLPGQGHDVKPEALAPALGFLETSTTA